MPFPNLFRRQPASIPTDQVIRLRYWDDLDYIRGICHDFTFRIDDVLDVDKLEAALHRLMVIKNWGQLGARLRRRSDGKLEYHLPESYTPTRPAFIFTRASHDMPIAQHAIASQLPGQNHPQGIFSPPGRFFEPLLRHRDSPKELADWIYTDRPQLHVHVVSFSDTTLITTSYIHTLFDAISRSQFWNAWGAVLSGREEEVPDMLPFDEDPLRDLGEGYSKETYHHFGLLLRGIGFIIFGIRYLLDILFSEGVIDHTIRIPGEYITLKHEEAKEELALSVPKRTAVPFISEGDIVISWWMRTMITALQPSPDRPILLLNVFNVWRLFPDKFPTAGKGFIGNAFFYSNALLSSGRVLADESLSYTALKTRQALSEHRTADQVQSMTSIQRNNYKRTAPITGRSNNLFMACTNQSMAGSFEVDFSGAVLRAGIALNERKHGLGRPSFIHDVEHARGYPTRNVVRILGQDARGDWWLLFKTRRGAWGEILRQVKAVYEGVGKKGEDIVLKNWAAG